MTDDVCVKCGEEIFESETLSRCLKCGKSTSREVNGKEYYKNKQMFIDIKEGVSY